MTLTLVFMWVLVLFPVLPPGTHPDKADTVAIRAFPVYEECVAALDALTKGVNPGDNDATFLGCVYEKTWVTK